MARSKGQDNMGIGKHSGMAHGHGHGARSQAWEHARAWAYAICRGVVLGIGRDKQM